MQRDPKEPAGGYEEGVTGGMHLTPERLEVVRGMLDQADHYLRSVRRMLFQESYREKAETLVGIERPGAEGETRVLEGIFDGEQMIGRDSRRYPVPPNYASKSKLVAGDVLKLTIATDGTFIFKQIGPVARQKIIGQLEEDRGRFAVVTDDGRRYQLLTASVTYYHAKPGDTLSIVIPREGPADWAALENVVGSDET